MLRRRRDPCGSTAEPPAGIVSAAPTLAGVIVTINRFEVARTAEKEAKSVPLRGSQPVIELLHKPSADASDGGAGWSSPVARQAHNLKVIGSNPIPATNLFNELGLP